jgi:hypothetical protein
MRVHGKRIGYFILEEGLVAEPQNFFAAPAHQPTVVEPPQVSPLRFGRMFGKTRHETAPEAMQPMIDKLIRLGRCMSNDPEVGCQSIPPAGPDESSIHAGYTYLGQFIAHEITNDNTSDLLAPGLEPENLRTPKIDLDSLYGTNDAPDVRDDKDRAKLKVGQTNLVPKLSMPFPNDLWRDESGVALIGDPRNDENLALAQTHVAFIKFHNKVVDKLRADSHDESELFERARKLVVRHFQWIILKDFLPKLVDESALERALSRAPSWLGNGGTVKAFMPLEFSVAAFRIGHSMVRASYEFNHYHSSDPPGSGRVSLIELFEQTRFSSDLGGLPRLQSDWIIDWRRFYDFEPLTGVPFGKKINMTTKLDTVFDLHIERVGRFQQLEKIQRAITVRNLLRGFYLGLPTGEEVAEHICVEPLTHEQIVTGPQQALLDDDAFRGRTPLWYYVLKEAELRGGSRLGAVGSHIVAETLIGLIKMSDPSILETPDWQPSFGPPGHRYPGRAFRDDRPAHLRRCGGSHRTTSAKTLS